MLQKIRDKVSGWVALFFLGAIAIVFIFWGIQFENTVTSVAAEVDGEDIPAQVVLQAWQQRQSELQQQIRDEIPADLARAEQRRLLDEFIDREVLVQRAHDSGYRVSDRELVEAIRQIEAVQVDGQFSRDRYAALLRQQGRSEAQFEREFRRDLESSQLRNAIAVSSFVTPGELERRVALEGEVREVAYAVIPVSSYAGQVEVTPEAVAGYYEEHKTEFTTTESVELQYLKLDLADIARSVEVTEDGLRRYYEEHAASNETPERRKASHILVEAGSDDAAARKKAEDLAARARSGEDFAKLARDQSDDVGSKASGGDLGWATRESYVPEFADALFAMEGDGAIAGPVRTQFGYHVIRLEGIEAPTVRPFEEARAELEPEFRREQAQSEYYERSQELADEAFASLTELESVARKLDLPLSTEQNFTRQGGGALGNDRKLIETVFSDEVLREGQNSPPVQLGEESVVVLRVTEHRPAEQRPLDEVREQIRARLLEEGARKAAADAATALARRVEAGEPFAEVMSAAGARPTPAQPITRTGPVDAASATPFAPELLRGIFQAPRPAGDRKASAGTVTLASGDQAAFAVSNVRPGTLDATAQAELPLRAQQSAQVRAAIEFTAYLEQIKQGAKIRRNERLFATEE